MRDIDPEYETQEVTPWYIVPVLYLIVLYLLLLDFFRRPKP